MIGAGRTDAGAHALAQVIAFDTESKLSLDVLQRAINAHLPADIALTSICDAESTFHPRYDACTRVYRYLIWNGPTRSPFHVGRAAQVRHPLDVVRMQTVAQALIGRHDFSSFVASTAEGSRVRTIERILVKRQGDLVAIEIEGSGFMKQMVRSIAGTLIEAGKGVMDRDDMQRILESRDRAQAGSTAPAEGLYLVRVTYDAKGDGQGAEFEERT